MMKHNKRNDMKKETKTNDRIGICTIKIKWQNADGYICVYPMMIGFIAEGYRNGGEAVVKKEMTKRAERMVSDHPEVFDSKDNTYQYRCSVKTYECDTFHVFCEKDFEKGGGR